MQEVKYVNVKISNHQTMLMFPQHIGHDEFVSNLGKTWRDVESAGFVCLKEIEGFTVGLCYGRSVSLGIDAAAGDSMMLTKDYFGVEAMSLIKLGKQYL